MGGKQNFTILLKKFVENKFLDDLRDADLLCVMESLTDEFLDRRLAMEISNFLIKKEEEIYKRKYDNFEINYD